MNSRATLYERLKKALKESIENVRETKQTRINSKRENDNGKPSS